MANIRDLYQASQPVVSVLLLDNYEDLMKNLTENQRSTIYSELNAPAGRLGGGHRRHAPAHRAGPVSVYLRAAVPLRFVERKFDILDTVHQVVSPQRPVRHLLHRRGVDGSSFQELLQFANLSIEMALSRGGDQAVIRNKFHL